ncbi:hypothetical protein [uncultured Pseudacidovorax sp.]|uniref:hypothetical protein n=1 Tax=uncultured Pseudacidovorax sp. TaxID=679313 RepID=UPI0025E84C8E|nr:hypothetical protein [uncultured Pseudacidovorax sp.]
MQVHSRAIVAKQRDRMVHRGWSVWIGGVLLGLGNTALAACDSGLAERMQAALQPRRVLDHDLAACKTWPTVIGRNVVVLPLQHAVSDRGARSLDMELLVVQRPDNGNTERDKVVARLFLPELLVEDADLRIQDVQLDTGRYLLANGERAFGLRVSYQRQDPARPYAAETLRLFVLDRKNTLRPAMDELVMRRDSGEWDLACQGRFEELRTQLTPQPVPRNGIGWAGLEVRRSLVVRHRAPDESGQCSEHAGAPRYTTVTLQASEGRYAIPPALRGP